MEISRSEADSTNTTRNEKGRTKTGVPSRDEKYHDSTVFLNNEVIKADSKNIAQSKSPHKETKDILSDESDTDALIIDLGKAVTQFEIIVR